MATISFYVHSYQEKLRILSNNVERIEAVPSSQISIGINVSDTIQAYYDMYYDICRIIKYYKWTLHDTVKNLANAGEALTETDQNLSNLFLTGGI